MCIKTSTGSHSDRPLHNIPKLAKNTRQTDRQSKSARRTGQTSRMEVAIGSVVQAGDDGFKTCAGPSAVF
ncbi:hypothetical protein THS27_20635 [Thalassospira sp. MCCC 1A01428]|nr:hypothetical protein THS27_20635 [Thalassospira sp. MCCC 1A01428]